MRGRHWPTSTNHREGQGPSKEYPSRDTVPIPLTTTLFPSLFVVAYLMTTSPFIFLPLCRKVSVLNWHDCTLPGRSIEDPKDCKESNTSVQWTKENQSNTVSLPYVRAMEKGCIYSGNSGVHPAILYTLYYMYTILHSSHPLPPPPHKLTNKCRRKKRNLRKNMFKSVTEFSSSNLRPEEKKFTTVHKQKKIRVKVCRLLYEPWRKDVFIEEIPSPSRRPLLYTSLNPPPLNPKKRLLAEFWRMRPMFTSSVWYGIYWGW
jgi:hypothetical protein